MCNRSKVTLVQMLGQINKWIDVFITHYLRSEKQINNRQVCRPQKCSSIKIKARLWSIKMKERQWSLKQRALSFEYGVVSHSNRPLFSKWWVCGESTKGLCYSSQSDRRGSLTFTCSGGLPYFLFIYHTLQYVSTVLDQIIEGPIRMVEAQPRHNSHSGRS